MFSKILIPYDGTTSSKKGFKTGLKIAKDNKATISVITCVEKKSTLGFFQSTSDKKKFERIKTEIMSHVEQLTKEAKKNDVSIKSKIVKSDLPSDAITEYAKSNDIDLIVISKSKLSTMYEKKYYNSTVENLMKDPPCSVLVVK